MSESVCVGGGWYFVFSFNSTDSGDFVIFKWVISSLVLYAGVDVGGV